MPADITQLSTEETARYQRQLVLPEIGQAGQLRLKQSKVLVIGAGGLGTPSLFYLAAAGVGTIGIVDDDVVDSSNLHRQILYTNDDVGKSKAKVAAHKLSRLNPNINTVAYADRFLAANAGKLVAQYDVVLDGTDNFSARYLVNDACVMAGKPNVHGAIYRFEGQVTVFGYKGGPCHRCIFPEPPAPNTVLNCAEAGVLGVIAGTIGTLQCTEALKILLGHEPSLSGRLAIYDAMSMRMDTLTIKREPACAACGDAPSIHELHDESLACGSTGTQIKQITASELAQVIVNPTKVQRSTIVLLDVREDSEFAAEHLAGALHIPLAKLSDRLDELQRSMDIVVYCRSGARSLSAAKLLIENGFCSVSNLDGGIVAWQKQKQ